MILAAIVIARNPAQYGFDFEPEAPHGVRHGHAAAPGRPAARRRVDRHAPSTRSRRSTRSCGAGPRRSRTRNYELKVPAGTGDDGAAQADRRAAADLRVAEVLHREARRHAAADRAQAARQQGRSGGSELPAGDGARRRRPEADGAARGDRADGGADRSPRAGDRGARDRRRSPASSREPAASSNRVKASYAVKRGDTLRVDRPPVQDDRRVAQELESAAARRRI